MLLRVSSHFRRILGTVCVLQGCNIPFWFYKIHLLWIMFYYFWDSLVCLRCGCSCKCVLHFLLNLEINFCGRIKSKIMSNNNNVFCVLNVENMLDNTNCPLWLYMMCPSLISKGLMNIVCVH